MIHWYRSLSTISILHNETVRLWLFQFTDSLRFIFFLQFLRLRRRILEYDPQLYIFEGSFNDFRLLSAAKRIPENSPIWGKALAKLQDGESEQQILEFLELAAIAEELGGK